MTVRLSDHRTTIVSSISSRLDGRRTVRHYAAAGVTLGRMAEPSIRDIDALVGPATPHFAYQVRARVRELIEDLRPTTRSAATARRGCERLDAPRPRVLEGGGRRAGVAQAARLGADPELGARVRAAAAAVMSFTGASVLVTGGSRGIGKAIALRFAGARSDPGRDRLHALGRCRGGDRRGAASARR